MGTTSKNLIDYFSKPMTSDQINYLNKLHEVTVEKCEVYRDFIISLNYCIYDTYLGDDVINSEDILLTHYNWCWSKTIDNFGEENLFFVEKGEHSFGAYVPDLPGCVAVGETRAEVMRLIRAAIEFHAEGLREDGQPVPPSASSIELISVGA
jgi:predicted RNase H-like HicB family nuclease